MTTRLPPERDLHRGDRGDVRVDVRGDGPVVVFGDQPAAALNRAGSAR